MAIETPCGCTDTRTIRGGIGRILRRCIENGWEMVFNVDRDGRTAGLITAVPAQSEPSVPQTQQETPTA